MIVLCGCGWRGDLTEWAATHACSKPHATSAYAAADDQQERVYQDVTRAIMGEPVPVDLLTYGQRQAACMIRARATLRVI